jgi:hypothetical protein
MIHGTPRARARRRLKEFFRHAVYVFVYVLYISFAAVVILKTVTPGGYASQVGMNSPVAKLVLVAMVSIVATGIFWWLKKELGDRTRQDLTHAVTDTYHHAREGFHRGRHTYARGREAANKARDRFGGRGDSADEEGGSSEGPLTAKPVNGRPPGGKPPRPQPNSLRPLHQSPGHTRPSPTKTPRAASAEAGPAGAATGGAEAVTVGVEAGGAVLAPEVAVPVAAAVAAAHHHKQHREHAQQRSTPPNGGAPDRPTDGRRGAPAAPQPSSPTSGRTSGGQPVPRTHHSNRGINDSLGPPPQSTPLSGEHLPPPVRGRDGRHP